MSLRWEAGLKEMLCHFIIISFHRNRRSAASVAASSFSSESAFEAGGQELPKFTEMWQMTR